MTIRSYLKRTLLIRDIRSYLVTNSRMTLGYQFRTAGALANRTARRPAALGRSSARPLMSGSDNAKRPLACGLSDSKV
jgi:hypothetical protein